MNVEYPSPKLRPFKTAGDLPVGTVFEVGAHYVPHESLPLLKVAASASSQYVSLSKPNHTWSDGTGDDWVVTRILQAKVVIEGEEI